MSIFDDIGNWVAGPGSILGSGGSQGWGSAGQIASGIASGTGFAPILGAVGSIINRNDQVNNNDYQRALNAQTMSREDNAIQRRIADLNAAGLSPTLAAGSAASSSSFRSGEVPSDNAVSGVYQGAIASAALAAQRAQVGQTQAQTNLINAQIPGAQAQSAMNLHDAGIYTKSPITTSRDTSTYAAVLRTLGLVPGSFNTSKGIVGAGKGGYNPWDK